MRIEFRRHLSSSSIFNSSVIFSDLGNSIISLVANEESISSNTSTNAVGSPSKLSWIESEKVMLLLPHLSVSFAFVLRCSIDSPGKYDPCTNFEYDDAS